MSEANNTPSMVTSVINYMLNRFMPYILVASILCFKCGFDSYVPYLVLGLMWFSSHFSFGCGVASSVVDSEFRTLESKILLERLCEEELKETNESEQSTEEEK